MPLSVSPDAAGCRNFIFSIAPGVCTEAVYAGDFAPSGSGYLTAGENGFICGSSLYPPRNGIRCVVKRECRADAVGGRITAGTREGIPGGRAHAAGKLERDLEAADFFQEQAREFQSLTELEEAMTAYEDQMDQNMADAADTAAHTCQRHNGAAFKTLPIAELVTMHGSKGLEYDAVFSSVLYGGRRPTQKEQGSGGTGGRAQDVLRWNDTGEKRAVSVVYERNEGNAGVCVPVSC